MNPAVFSYSVKSENVFKLDELYCGQECQTRRYF